jgi:hypothetical protein
MNGAWAIRLAKADAAAAVALRQTRGVEVAETDDSLWLRGQEANEKLECSLKCLPAIERFERLGDDRLRPLESRIAALRFPPLQWQAIEEWSSVQLPVAALPGAAPWPCFLRLARTGKEEKANLLCTRFDAWASFVLNSSTLRLAGLRHAISASRQVIVWGTPLPPVPGRRYVEQEGIAIPAGFCWSPLVSREVLQQVLRVAEDSLVIWHEDGSLLRLHSEQLVGASRSGTRAARELLRKAS